MEIGPSGVLALPLAAGRNEGGHYFRYCFYHVPFPWKGRGQHAVNKLVSSDWLSWFMKVILLGL